MQTALITGASSGVGAIYANRFARRGLDLVLVARDGQRLKAMAARLFAETGRSVRVMPADLTNNADLIGVERVLRDDAVIDVLVNNAGIVLSGDTATADPDRLESMIRLNVLAPTRLAAAAVPGFVRRHRGTIINIASVAALAPEWLNGAYSGTKAYMLTLSLKLRQELAGTGVRVQAVLPGALETPLWESAGIDVHAVLPREMLMAADDMVDAALAGLDNGESVTIPSLPDIAEWDAYEAVRVAMGPRLSRSAPAQRYRAAAANLAGA